MKEKSQSARILLLFLMSNTALGMRQVPTTFLSTLKDVKRKPQETSLEISAHVREVVLFGLSGEGWKARKTTVTTCVACTAIR